MSTVAVGQRRVRSATSVLLGVTWRGWFNQLDRGLGGRWRAAALVAGLGTLALTALAWSSMAMLDTVAGLDLVREAPAVVVGAVACLSALGALVAGLYTPDRNVLVAHLSALPVPREVLRRAARAQEMLVGGTLALLLTGPILVQPLVSGGLEQRVRAGAILIGTVALVTVLTLLATRILEAGLVRLAVPPLIGRALAALLVLSAFAWLFLAAMPVNQNVPHGPAIALGEALVWALSGPVGWSLAVGLGLLGWALWRVSGWWEADAVARDRVNLQVPAQRAAAGMTALERRQWLRFGPNLVMLVFLNGVALLALVAMATGGGDQLGTAYLILPILSAIGVGAFGPTRRVLWLFRVTGAPTAWVVPKMLAVLSVWAMTIAAYSAALVWLGQWTFVELAWTLPLLAAEVLVAMAIGVVLPVSAEQSINGSVSEAATLVLLIALTVGVQSALGSITILPLAIAVQTFVLLGALAGYLLVARAASRA
jgi:hypothetical protein